MIFNNVFNISTHISLFSTDSYPLLAFTVQEMLPHLFTRSIHLQRKIMNYTRMWWLLLAGSRHSYLDWQGLEMVTLTDRQ
jgi:hypothetical protein